MKIRIAMVLLLCLLLTACAAPATQSTGPSTPSTRPSYTNPPEHVCDFGEWVTVQEATCLEDGRSQRSCSCKLTENRILWATGHSFDENNVCARCRSAASQGLAFALSESGDGYKITGMGTCRDTVLTLPAWHLGKPVTAIDTDAFYNQKEITTLVLPASVKRIGAEAFGFCKKLNRVILQEGLETIEKDAFSQSGILMIHLPQSIKELGNGAFSYCDGLSSLEIPSGITRIPDSLCASSRNLMRIDLPAGVIAIGKEAFSFCESLRILSLPDALAVIEDDAFRDCAKLSEISFPQGLTHLGKNAFLNCHGLRKLVLPDSLAIIREGTFRNCTGLTDVALGNAVVSIGKEAFSGCTGLRQMQLPQGLSSLEKRAFYGCIHLESLFLPGSLTGLGEEVFLDCQKLDTISFGGTAAQWRSIYKGPYWNLRTDTYVVRCSDGEVPKGQE